MRKRAGAGRVGRWFGPGRRPSIGAETLVMLGDSITASGDWKRLLPNRRVVNEGHAGTTTAELVAVASRVADARPAELFLLVGTNDIRDGHHGAWTVRHLMRLLDEFESKAPATRVVVQTILPRADAVGQVRETNRLVADTAGRRGLELLDLHAGFDDGNGGIRPEETTDGIHLTGAGYDRWVGHLLPVLGNVTDR